MSVSSLSSSECEKPKQKGQAKITCSHCGKITVKNNLKLHQQTARCKLKQEPVSTVYTKYRKATAEAETPQEAASYVLARLAARGSYNLYGIYEENKNDDDFLEYLNKSFEDGAKVREKLEEIHEALNCIYGLLKR